MTWTLTATFPPNDNFYSLIGSRRGISGFEKSLGAADGPTPMDVRRSAKEK